MGINLLPQVEKTEKKHIAAKTGIYIIGGIWLGAVILVTGIFYFYRGLAYRRLAAENAEKRKVIRQLENISDQVDTYYNIAYKSLVLSYVSKKKYKPSVVAEYIQKQVGTRGEVKEYYIDSSGTIRVSIVASDYSNAMAIWHSLLENENIIEELNLNKFSQQKTGHVQFDLKGKLNLDELYKAYGKEKKEKSS